MGNRCVLLHLGVWMAVTACGDLTQALAKESLSQLSKSLGAMQSKASAALVQSHELTETLQLVRLPCSTPLAMI